LPTEDYKRLLKKDGYGNIPLCATIETEAKTMCGLTT